MLGQSLQQVGEQEQASITSKIGSQTGDVEQPGWKPQQESTLPHVVPPKSSNGDSRFGSPRNIPVASTLSDEDNPNLGRQAAETAATAPTVATRDFTRGAGRLSAQGRRSQDSGLWDTARHHRPSVTRTNTLVDR